MYTNLNPDGPLLYPIPTHLSASINKKLFFNVHYKSVGVQKEKKMRTADFDTKCGYSIVCSAEKEGRIGSGSLTNYNIRRD